MRPRPDDPRASRSEFPGEAGRPALSRRPRRDPIEVILRWEPEGWGPCFRRAPTAQPGEPPPPFAWARTRHGPQPALGRRIGSDRPFLNDGPPFPVAASKPPARHPGLLYPAD